jgi:3-hydroxyisobutyrate/3-hydroxypropionate dehydrogenase
MVGGLRNLFEKALPVLSMKGKRDSTIHCGDAGAGPATKQLNNYLAYLGYLGLCEVMNAGVKYGLDPKTLSDVINKSSGMNWNSLNHNPVNGVNPKASSSNDFKPGFTTELAAGVITDACDLMNEAGAKTVLAPTVRAVFDRALQDRMCKGMEARSVWRLFGEEDGDALQGL